MTTQTIDLLRALECGPDLAPCEDVRIDVGDLLELEAHTPPLSLPGIFHDENEEARRWIDQVQAQLRARGVHTVVISVEGRLRYDDVHVYMAELQVAFLGDFPVQLDAQGQFYGYDAMGNLITFDQAVERQFRKVQETSPLAGFAAGINGSVVVGALAVVGVVGFGYGIAHEVRLTFAELTKPAPDGQRTAGADLFRGIGEAAEPVSSALVVVAAAVAVIVIMVYVGRARAA